MKYYRNEYPRPQFRRDNWLSLNGEWEFAFDDADDGVHRNLPSGKIPLERSINVPFTYEYEASGIGEKDIHQTVWYRRKFTLPDSAKNKHALLCFNASDYQTDVWINGHHAVSHTGGFAPFSADVTKLLKGKDNVIVVRCYDPLDPNVPRGKQSWQKSPFSCWYVPNTGIWQSVWIDFFGADLISNYTLIPDIDTCSFSGDVTTFYGSADQLELIVTFNEKQIKKQCFTLDGKHTRYTVNLMEQHFVDETMYWTPENPRLMYVDFTLYKGGKVVDVAHTRFGMRKISIDDNGQICLNNSPLYQRLVLDQGYWVHSGLTPPSAEALKQDIQLAKSMGFNGARKHQKFEDPYYYYYAEELGFLVWCEMPSAYNFHAEEIFALSTQWQEILHVAKNFTSIICYVPLNESWSTRKILTDSSQQDFARAMYYLTKSVDGNRLVSTNDGFENVDATDITSIHDYAFDSSAFLEKYKSVNYDSLYVGSHKVLVNGCAYLGQPILMDEFGGIALTGNTTDSNWGYNSGAENTEEFVARIKNLVEGIYNCPFQGFCYTQLSDVQQEVNGLLDEHHKPKVDPATLKNIFENTK